MSYIELPEGMPGIRGPMMFSLDTTKPMRELAEVRLRGPSTLTPAEREVIATYVSAQNDCHYCQSCHGATAAEYLGGDYDLVGRTKQDYEATELSEKMKALLAIAGRVQLGGKHVTEHDVARARERGATDKEIHGTILIAAAFCMFNRYVDGLGTWQPEDPEFYKEVGRRTSSLGYIGSGWEKPISSTTK